MDQKTSTNNIFVFIFGFILGILVSSFILITPLVGVFVVMIGLTLLIAEKICLPREASAKWGKVPKEVLFLSLVFLSFGLGALRYSIKDFHEPLIPTSSGIVVRTEGKYYSFCLADRQWRENSGEYGFI